MKLTYRAYRAMVVALTKHLFPRDHMLVQCVSRRRVSVCLSVTRWYCIKTAARSELIFFAYMFLSTYACFRRLQK